MDSLQPGLGLADEKGLWKSLSYIYIYYPCHAFSEQPNPFEEVGKVRLCYDVGLRRFSCPQDEVGALGVVVLLEGIEELNGFTSRPIHVNHV